MTDRYGFRNRINYYVEQDPTLLSNASEIDQLLQPQYFIAILDFNFFQSLSYLSYNLEREGKRYPSGKQKFIFIELQKFYCSLEECNTLLKQWIFFIKKGGQVLDVPKIVTDKGLITAYQAAALYNWSKEEYRAYDKASIALQDARGRITAAEKKGMAKGIEQGKA